MGCHQVPVLHQLCSDHPLPGHHREFLQKLLEHPVAEPASLQKPRLPQEQRPGADGGDHQPVISPELLQKGDVPPVQQHRQRLPDTGQHQAVDLLPAEVLEGAVRQDREPVLAFHRRPLRGVGDDLLVVEQEQLRQAADLLEGEQRIEHHSGFLHIATSSFSVKTSPPSVKVYSLSQTSVRNFLSWDTAMMLPP